MQIDRCINIIVANKWTVFKATNDVDKAPIVKRKTSWKEKQYQLKPTAKLLAGARDGDYTIACVMPKDIFCIDIDDRKQLKVLEKAVGIKLLNTTLAVKSGRGYHLYYKRPKKVELRTYKKRIEVWRETDVRKNGYMIIPPSLHYLKKHHYEYIDNGFDVAQKPPGELVKFLKECNAKLDESEDFYTQKSIDNIQGADKAECKISIDDLETLLDSMRPEMFNSYEKFYNFLAATHFTTAGSKAHRDVFMAWATSDPEYADPEIARKSLAMWKTSKLKRKNMKRVGTFVAMCKEYSSLSSVKIQSFIKNPGEHKRLVEKLGEYLDDAAPSKQKTGKNKQTPISNVVSIDDSPTLARLNEIFESVDLKDVRFHKAVEECYSIVSQMPGNDALSRSIGKQLQRAVGYNLKEHNAMLKRARQIETDNDSEDEDSGGFSIDSIMHVVKQFSEKHTYIYTQKEFFSRNDGRLWEPTPESTVLAQMKPFAQQHATTEPNMDINKFITESVKRLALDVNVDTVIIESVEKNVYNHRVLGALKQLSYKQNNCFTNQENIAVAGRLCALNLQGGELVIDVNRHSKALQCASIYQHIKPSMSTDQLLTLDIDRRNAELKKLVTYDTQLKDKYYRQSFHADFMSDKAVRKAIKRGGAKNFIAFLDAISAGQKNPNFFITGFLDAMAYMVQPIKMHSLFFYYYGYGENGKSFCMKILSRIAGERRIAMRNFRALTENPRFFENRLAESYCTFDDDLGSFNKETAALTKKYSGGTEMVNAELKNSNQENTFLLKCCMTALSNNFITLQDKSVGQTRRLFLLDFKANVEKTYSYAQGTRVLENELTLVFNILRLRMPRVIVNGPQKFPDMLADIANLIKGDNNSRLLLENIKHKDGAKISVVQITENLNAELHGQAGANNKPLSVDGVTGLLHDHNFTIDSKNRVINARWKK